MTVGLVDPLATDVVLCTYAETLDAFVGAWVVRKAAREHNIPVEFGHHPSPFKVPPLLAGRNWINIGCSDVFPSPTERQKSLLAFLQGCSLTVMPPIPFGDWTRTMPFGVETMQRDAGGALISDLDKSLALLVWQFFFDTEPPPRLVAALNAAATSPDDAALCECAASYPLDFGTIDKLVAAAENPRKRELMIAAGQGILRYREKNHA